jgi:hypothetical protein
VDGEPGGGAAIALVDGLAPRPEAGAVEQAGLVELGDHPADLLGARGGAVTAREDGLDVAHGALAIEQRDQVDQGPGQQDDPRGHARGVAQREQALAILVDGKGVEVAQARPEERAVSLVGHGGAQARGQALSRNFRADAT